MAISASCPTTRPDAVYLLDVSAFIFRAYYALPPMSNSHGEATHAVRGVLSMLEKLKQDYEPSALIAVGDAGSSTFRNGLYADYKANRGEPPEDLSSQIDAVYELLDALGVPTVTEEQLEADDIIATLVRQAEAAGRPVVVVSADKDLMQLVSADVCMLDTMRGRTFDPQAVIDKLGVPPVQVRDYLALVGDTSDNIPGAKGIGPKSAVKLLEAFGSVDSLLERVEEVTPAGLQKKVRASAESIRLSKTLVSLREDANVALDRLLEPLPEKPEALEQLFRRFEFRSHLRALELGGDTADIAVQVCQAPPEATSDTVVDAQWDDDVLWLVGATTQAAWVCRAPTREAIERLWAGPDGPAFTDSKAFYKSALAKDKRPGGFCPDMSLARHLAACGGRTLKLDDALQQAGLHAPMAAFPGEASIPEATAVATQACIKTAALLPYLRQQLEKTGQSDLFATLECPLAVVLGKMEEHGIAIDLPLLDRLSQELERDLAKLESACHEAAGKTFNVGSPRQLETILFDDLGLPVVKRTKTARSTSSEVLEELARAHALPKLILEYRQLAKLKSTYVDALPKVAKEGRVHTTFHQDITATGRLSSSDPNLQNIPIRTERGRVLREAFIATEGMQLVAGDYSQIELRVLAHLSGDEALRRAFADNLDVHALTAAALFGVEESDVTRDMRGVGKTINFAVIYGQSDFALSKALDVERAQAAAYIKSFFERYEGVRQYFDSVVEHAKESGYVTTMFGRRRTLGDLHSRNAHLRQGAQRIAQNTPIQGSAADIMKRAMLKVDEQLTAHFPGARMLLSVHDELLLEAPSADAESVRKLLQSEMENAVELDVPLEVSVGVGDTWAVAHA